MHNQRDKLKSLSDTKAKLQSQLREVAEQETAILQSLAQARATQISDELTREMVNLFAPEHGRTSCSDSDLANHYINDNEPRCVRCFLLMAVKEHYFDPDFDLRLEVIARQ